MWRHKPAGRAHVAVIALLHTRAPQDLTLLSMRRAVLAAASTGAADVKVLAIERVGDLDYPLPETRGNTTRCTRTQSSESQRCPLQTAAALGRHTHVYTTKHARAYQKKEPLAFSPSPGGALKARCRVFGRKLPGRARYPLASFVLQPPLSFFPSLMLPRARALPPPLPLWLGARVLGSCARKRLSARCSTRPRGENLTVHCES